MRSLSLVLVLGLVTACAASTGVKSTDLSEIKIGVSRAKVEAALGKPLMRRQTDYGFAAAYTYNKGSDPALPRSYRGCVGACAMGHMLVLLLSPLAHESIVEKQKRRLTVVFDDMNRVKKIFHGRASDLRSIRMGTSRDTVDIIFGPELDEAAGARNDVATYVYEGKDFEFGRLHVTYRSDDRVQTIRIEKPMSGPDRATWIEISKRAKLGDRLAKYLMERGIRKTDLSAIRVGTQRQEVEKILGPAISAPNGNQGTATYYYNEGLQYEPQLCDYRACIPLHPTWSRREYGIFDSAEKAQRGEVLITYGASSEAEKVQIATPKELRRKKIRLKAESGDAEAQYALWHPSDQNHRLLCLAAQNGHSSAQVQLGERYWAGTLGFKQDRALGFMWFSLSARQENIRGKFEVAEKRPLLKPEEIASAEKLIAEWKPDPASCGT